MSRVAKQKRSEQTLRAILDAARGVFAERGYAGASLEEIAEDVGISRGPLYHYFVDKRDLFHAVYEEVEREMTDRIAADFAARIPVTADAWEQVRLGTRAFLDICLDPEIQRIALIEAPLVLGGDASRDLARFGLDLIRRGLQRAIDHGDIERQPVEPLARLLRATIVEGAIIIARSDDHDTARAEVGAALDRIIDGLRQPAHVTRSN